VAGSPYHITATLSSSVAGALANYTITNAGADFTIDQKPASVTPNASSKNFGDPDPALTGTLVGFLTTDGVTATYIRAPGETVAGSPYIISATLSPAPVLGNYNITYNTANFTINNVAPVVGAINTPIAPAAINTTVNVSAPFTDPSSPAVHTVLWTWDDGTTSSGTTNETTPFNGSGIAYGSHVYAQAGIYTISVKVTDSGSLFGTATAQQYIVIYDPNGGFVTGGGWINSPAGAYPASPTLAGRANFGFVSKYQKGANMPPVGETEFQFQVANFNFHSTSYDWLVVSSTKLAQYKGTGTVNGNGNYGFLLTAIDDSTDQFRIKIWDKSGACTSTTLSCIVYDNKLGSGETSSDATAISGGSIVIHK
jgi:hypothetical protein